MRFLVGILAISACHASNGFTDPIDAGTRDDSPIVDAAGDDASDPVQPEIIMFGGANGSTKLADTWTFDGTSWQQLAVTGPPAGSGVMAARAHDIVLEIAGETWIFDGATWTQLAITGPSARSGAMMTSLGDKAVLFGGASGSTTLADTWVFDGIAWTEIMGAGPPARSNAAFATLGALAILHAGHASGGTSRADTWSFDGTTWTQLADGPDAFFPAMSTQGAQLVMYRGPSNAAAPDTTWTFDGTKFTQLQGVTVGSSRFFEGIATLDDQVVMFGGQVAQAAVADTSVFTTKWTKLAGAQPSARSGPAMATRQ